MMTMPRLLIAIALVSLALAQQPSFEVASIKPNKSAGNNGTWRSGDNGRFTGENIPVDLLIVTAFKLKESQLSNLPKWAESEKYDIEAKTTGKASQDQMIAMLQALLRDRFSLKYHRAKKTMPVYSLVVGKSGIKAAASNDGPCPTDAICGSWFSRRNQIEGKRITMTQLADALTFQLDRIVIDKSGLHKTFDILLTWSPDQDDIEGPSIFTAVQEQLGVKLEASKAPVDMFVIDHIETPSDN